MKIHKCNNCKIYTLKDDCKQCGGKTNLVKPVKYSPEDKYGQYRRLMKKELKWKT